jgi:chromate transporter
VSLTSFGGPEMHLALFKRKFVDSRKIVTDKELLELNSLCQILPGPSSTQTLVAIAYKRGGPGLAFLSLLIWILPAAVLMSLFALSTNIIDLNHFRFIGPMALGFVFVSALQLNKQVKKTYLPIFLVIISVLISFLFHTPYVFPLLLIFGAVLNVKFGDKNFIPNNKPLVNIRWANLTLMLMILVFAALLGAITKSNFPKLSEPVRLFENTYRMGSLVFGGGNILYSMILTEFVEFKQKQYLTLQEFSTGIGLLQAIPGPTFTIATYANGILGCGLGTIAVFLPGTLLIFFLYPIWNQIKNYPIVYRSLDGIIAISVGFLWSAAFIMLLSFVKQIDINHHDSVLSLIVFLITFVSLRYQKIPAILLVVLSVCLGYFVT